MLPKYLQNKFCQKDLPIFCPLRMWLCTSENKIILLPILDSPLSISYIFTIFLYIFLYIYHFSSIKCYGYCTKVLLFGITTYILPFLYNFFHWFNIYTVHFPKIFLFLTLRVLSLYLKMPLISQQAFFPFSIHKSWSLMFTQALCKEVKCSLKTQPKHSVLIKINYVKVIIYLCIFVKKRWLCCEFCKIFRVSSCVRGGTPPTVKVTLTICIYIYVVLLQRWFTKS